jgi:hypothetical protein
VPPTISSATGHDSEYQLAAGHAPKQSRDVRLPAVSPHKASQRTPAPYIRMSMCIWEALHSWYSPSGNWQYDPGGARAKPTRFWGKEVGRFPSRHRAFPCASSSQPPFCCRLGALGARLWSCFAHRRRRYPGGRGSVLKQKNWNCRFADSGTSTCSNLKASNRPQLTGK